MSRPWIRRCAGAVAVAGLAWTPAAVAAPAAISGTDGDAWNTTPTYVVTGGEGGVVWSWTAGPRSGSSLSSPFEVQPAGLGDGSYVLDVRQRSPRGTTPRDERTLRRFTIDTQAPGALEVLGPSAITAGQPLAVSWTGGEADAVFTWSVVVPGRPGADDDDGGGDDEGPPDNPVQGPVDTAEATATISGLVPGSYEVLVTQRDRAGNVSDVARLPVAVGPSLVPSAGRPAPAPASAAPPTTLPRRLVTLPNRNSGRLRPRRAVTVPTPRPVLRWTNGPRGTAFYNVQLFRVRSAATASETAEAVTVRKISSIFPRGTQVRARGLTRGACYVWRVWPYLGGRYTPAPLGVSHFCVSRTPRAAAR